MSEPTEPIRKKRGRTPGSGRKWDPATHVDRKPEQPAGLSFRIVGIGRSEGVDPERAAAVESSVRRARAKIAERGTQNIS